MTAIDSIIDFLEKKMHKINNEIIEANKMIASCKFSNSDESLKYEVVAKEIKFLLARDKTSQSIINCLLDLGKIKKKSKSCKYPFLENEYDEFLNMQVEKTVNNQLEHLKNLPLFGFKPFHDKLFHQYVIVEDYEKCAELQTEINNSKSLLSSY